jgi:two-component system chemotaxis response regulator CheY
VALVGNKRNNMKALLVDDSRAMRMILARTLKEIGFEVTEAGHGLEALERLRTSGPFDLALVDWNMPEMDGLTFVTAVRTGQLATAMRIVMVTTESEADRVAAALAAGADEYVTKPFTKDALTSKLSMIGLLGV